MLLKQFALAVGADKNSVETVEHEHFTKEMIETFSDFLDQLMQKD